MISYEKYTLYLYLIIDVAGDVRPEHPDIQE